MTIYTAIGLMSGTSLDGIDVALIKTDGYSMVERLDFASYPYADDVRDALLSCLGLDHDPDGRVAQAEHLMTQAHIQAVKDFGHQADVIGFHGQTIFHDPDNGKTWQIGDGELLAQACGMDVVFDMRSNDVAHGGQGAPLLPLYHQVLVQSANMDLPVVILNIGGVANVTWIGKGNNDILAFDTGTGNALLNDWVMRHIGSLYDEDGRLAASGCVDRDHIAYMLKHEYFTQSPPKSLDRNTFMQFMPDGLSAADGAATLTEMTIVGIVDGFKYFPAPPRAVYVAGGGRKNGFMMRRLAEALACDVASVDELGWSGDAIEAEGFAYLAVRSLLGLDLTLPQTTGCKIAVSGGKYAPYRRNG